MGNSAKSHLNSDLYLSKLCHTRDLRDLKLFVFFLHNLEPRLYAGFGKMRHQVVFDVHTNSTATCRRENELHIYVHVLISRLDEDLDMLHFVVYQFQKPPLDDIHQRHDRGNHLVCSNAVRSQLRQNFPKVLFGITDTASQPLLADT